jgi:hypothetical protein
MRIRRRVIVLINGAFGVGKSTAARLLARRLTGALVYDPEVIGLVLRRVGRPLIRGADYQDLAVWCALTAWGAWLLRRTRRTLIVPMALWRRDRFAEVAGELRRADPDLRCFRLTAGEETLRRRILASPDRSARRWRLEHVASGLAAAADPAFGVEVPTDGRTPAEVVETLLALLAADAGPG